MKYSRIVLWGIAIFCFRSATAVAQPMLGVIVSLVFLCCTEAEAQREKSPPGFQCTTHDPGLFLFVDDYWIVRQQGLRRVVSQAVPLEEPIIWPDDPRAETDCAWGKGENYEFRPRSPADVSDVETMLGKYAESEDGLHWRKPPLDLIEFRGSRKDNIILNGQH
jgi:hypothetical protein